MRKILTIIMVLVFVLALGCSNPAEVVEQPASTPEPAPAAPAAPAMGQVEHPEEEVTPPPAPAPAPEEPATIGTRVEGTEQTAVDEEVSEDIEEIRLNTDKTMSSGDKTVKVGTTLAWKNYDTDRVVHVLAIESGSGFDTVRHTQSDRLLEGGVFEYTFKEKGKFLVRDIFSGKMRMYVTVE